MSRSVITALIVFTCAAAGSAFAQSSHQPNQPAAAQPPPKPVATAKPGPAAPETASPGAVVPAIPAGMALPTGYVVGIEDKLDVVVWKDKEMSAEGVVVRPDGMISLPLVNDVSAVGLTVEQLRATIEKAAAKHLQDPTVSVVIKEINSRRVSITGQVAKPAQYPLLGRMTVVELISTAGGVAEFAKTKDIRITRKENGTFVSKPFNYKDFLDGKPKALEQNIELMPGDLVTVP